MKKPRPTCMWGCVTDRGYDRAESVLSAGKDCSRETLTPNEREADKSKKARHSRRARSSPSQRRTEEYGLCLSESPNSRLPAPAAHLSSMPFDAPPDRSEGNQVPSGPAANGRLVSLAGSPIV